MIARREYEKALWDAFDKAYWFPAGAIKKMGIYSDGHGVWIFDTDGAVSGFNGLLESSMGKESFAAYDCLLWASSSSYEEGCGMLRRLIEFVERGKSITSVRMRMMRLGQNKGRKQ